MNPVFLRKLFEWYILEDAFFEDITTESISKGKKRRATIRAKEDIILAGAIFIEDILSVIGGNFSVELKARDGDFLKKGEEIATVEADDKVLLYTERVCLNILQRLSGIATKTRVIAELLKPFKTKITDTRKTTPGMRYLEKYAVRIGGGVNHRMGLFDAVLIKDNHIKAAGGIAEAVRLVKSRVSFTTKIEVECENLQMVKEAKESGVDIIMLDNMGIDDMKKAVEMYKGVVLFEASGNIDESNVVDVAETGVDFISSGAIIHHACWVDINMKLE